MDIETLAKKFKTSPEEVKEIFEQMRQEKRQEIQKAIEDNLEKASADGKITPQQKDTINTKLSEIRKRRMELREAKEDLENWAEENNVDLQGILPEKDFHRHRGFGHF